MCDLNAVRRGQLLDVVVPLRNMRRVRFVRRARVRRVLEEGAAPLAERLRIHNTMRIRGSSPQPRRRVAAARRSAAIIVPPQTGSGLRSSASWSPLIPSLTHWFHLSHSPTRA